MNLQGLESELNSVLSSGSSLINNQMLSFDRCEDKLKSRSNMQFDFYKPYPVFEEFHRLGKKARIRCLMAANRIGKTICCFAETAMHITLTYPAGWDGQEYQHENMVVWVGGRASDDLERLKRGFFDGSSEFPPFIHPSLMMYSNDMKRLYKIRNALGGTTTFQMKTCAGGVEKKNTLSSWTGDAVDFIWLDEPPPMHVFNEAKTRITNTRKGDHRCMIISSTCTERTEFYLSMTERSEAYEEEFNGEKVTKYKQFAIAPKEIVNGNVYVTASLDDAPHLSAEEKKRMIESWHPMERQARSTGIPLIGSGMVFPVLEECMTYSPFDIPEHYARIGGMDFGWIDPTVVLLGALNRDKNILYVYFEYMGDRKTPKQHMFNLSQMRPADCLRWVTVMGDPAGQASSQKDGESLFEIYKKESGLKLVKADNREKSARIMDCLQRMYDGTLKISTECRGLLNEIRSYAYDKNKVKDGNDHHIDALLYMITGLKYATSKRQTEIKEDYSENDYGYWYGE